MGASLRIANFAPMSSVHFTFSEDDTVLAQFELGPGEYIVGRDEGCQVVIDLEGISPRHARIQVGDTVSVEDLETGLGTYLAGKRLTGPAPFTAGQPLTFGTCAGELRIDPPPGREPWPTPAERSAVVYSSEHAAAEVQTIRQRVEVGDEVALEEIQKLIMADTRELRELHAENGRLREANQQLVVAGQQHATAQESASLFKVANRALIRKLSQAVSKSDEVTNLRKELRQREKALVEAWSRRQAADERCNLLTRQVAALEAGRAAPVEHKVNIPTWLAWSIIGGVVAIVMLGVMVRMLDARAQRAEAIVAHVQSTAPEFYLEARALLKEGEFQQALGKIDAAIALDPSRSVYQLIKGHACESLLLLDPAIAAYEKVLTLTPTNTLALANLELCRKARASRRGPAAPENLYEFHRLMVKQGRLAEALHMAQRLPEDHALLQRTWAAILQGAGLNPQLDLNPDGTFDLNLNEQSRVDLALLRGLPLRKLTLVRSQVTDLAPLRGTVLRFLDLSGNPVRDLSPLAGAPLETLNLSNTEVTNLFPLAGMPLHELILDHSPIDDFTALRGMGLETLRADGTTVWNLQPLSESPLRVLDLARTRVSDLGPLAHLPLTWLNLESTPVANLAPLSGAPLAYLDLSHTAVRDLTPLRAMPLHELLLAGCAELTDVQVLRGCPGLERLLVPKQCTRLQILRQLPRLRFLAYDSGDPEADRKVTAQFFWSTYRGL